MDLNSVSVKSVKIEGMYGGNWLTSVLCKIEASSNCLQVGN